MEGGRGAHIYNGRKRESVTTVIGARFSLPYRVQSVWSCGDPRTDTDRRILTVGWRLETSDLDTPINVKDREYKKWIRWILHSHDFS